MSRYKNYIENRVLEEANYIIENGATVREVAKKFMVSKSTIHKDMVIKLAEINKDLHKRVKDVLQANLDVRHIRGGISTKLKYMN